MPVNNAMRLLQHRYERSIWQCAIILFQLPRTNAMFELLLYRYERSMWQCAVIFFALSENNAMSFLPCNRYELYSIWQVATCGEGDSSTSIGISVRTWPRKSHEYAALCNSIPMTHSYRIRLTLTKYVGISVAFISLTSPLLEMLLETNINEFA
jgi:hypothetical protein